MSDLNSKASNPNAEDTPFVEDDHAETVMTYGDGSDRLPLVAVWMVWIGFAIGLASYLGMYLFPDLAEWRAWY
jgi:hypothetical protein